MPGCGLHSHRQKKDARRTPKPKNHNTHEEIRPWVPGHQTRGVT